MIWLYAFATVLLAVGLPVFSYLDHIYRRLGRVSTGRLREHLEIFEAEIEPRLHLNRRQAALTFNLLPHLWLALIVLETARGVFYFVPDVPEATLELFVFLGLEVAVGMHFIPDFFLARTTGRWLLPLIPVLRAAALLVWPLRALLDLATTLARISEEEPDAAANSRADSEGIEALVEAAEEEGIIEPGQADLFEQIVEFSDKRVREVMTPRPDIVAIQAGATVEALRKLVVETSFSKKCARKISTWPSSWTNMAPSRGSRPSKTSSKKLSAKSANRTAIPRRTSSANPMAASSSAAACRWTGSAISSAWSFPARPMAPPQLLPAF